MDDAELLERCREYDSDKDIENTENPNHIAGSYGMRLADMVLTRKHISETPSFEKCKLQQDNPGLWNVLHRLYELEIEAKLEERKVAI